MWYIGLVWEYLFHRIWDVSSLSLYDRIALSASFYYAWDDRLNCSRALERIEARVKDRDQALMIVRAKFGCNTRDEKPRVKIDGIGYHSCLCNYQHPLFHTYMELATMLDRGVLPDRGAYLDQPAAAMEAIQLLNRLKAEAQHAEAEKARKNLDGRR